MNRSHRRLLTRAVALLSAVSTVGSLAAGPASAATAIGWTFDPPSSCAFPATYVQKTAPPGTSYATATDGVITSWQFQADGFAPQLELKVFRPTGGSSYLVVGSSEQELPRADRVSIYPVRIPVAAGDLIGLTTLSAGNCADSATATMGSAAGDAAVGSNLSYSEGAGTLDVAARVEPDSDRDGYGDETQEVAPETSINAGPTRTDKRQATFLFGSAQPGATFECRLKGARVKPVLKAYRPCTSPKKYKRLKPGTYTFFVRATGPSGNVDPTPDRQTFKVVPRR